MGIYDRDYVRNEGPSYLGSFLERGTICKWLIGINIVCFVVQMVTPGAADPETGAPLSHGPFTDWFVLGVDEVLHGQVWRLVTYAFLHSTSSLWHILWNMLFLWWFGTDMEDMYGPREFLGYYLVSAVAGGLVFVAASLAMPGLGKYALGASGAVTAVMVLFAIHYPTRIIYIFFFLPVPIWLLVIFNVATDSYVMLSGHPAGVAVGCHLGGAAFALLYYKLNFRISSLWGSLRLRGRGRRRPPLRIYREDDKDRAPEPVAAPVATHPEVEDDQLEAKLDAVLEKLSRVGREGLTDNEREVLLRASQKMKKRRGPR